VIADLKPYPAYKDSGLAWLGPLPSHWGQRRMKFLFKERTQKGFPQEPLLAATQTKGVVRKDDYGKRTVTAMKDFHLLKLVEIGDFVISLRSFEGGIEVSHCRGIISPAYTVLKPSDAASLGYYSRFFKSADFIRSLTLFVTGIREGQNIDYERMSRAYMPLPPLDEQIAIGRFLDWANARLERTIRAKRRVIALLTEQKQAIIHRAVTRGLDPTVPLKPSGIPWLGDIPAHWEVRPLKAVCHIQSGTTLGKDYGGQQTREIPYLRVANVQAGYVSLKVVKKIAVPASEANRRFLQAGDVLMTEGGDADKLGRGCVWQAQVSPCLHQNHVFAVRPNQTKLVPQFLSALLGTGYARGHFQSTAKQTTNLAATNKTKIGQLSVLLPSVTEQQQILASLEIETQPVDTAISRLNREIDLLREYRTRLVADVVTGKLDVRAAAAALPQEELATSSEPDALDADDDPDALDESETDDEVTTT